MDLPAIEDFNNFATGGLEPDLTLLFDLDVTLARARMDGRGERRNEARFDNERRLFHENVRAGYLVVQGNNQDRCQLINAARSIDTIAGDVDRLVDALLIERGILSEAATV
jgi:dTMP kinase